MESQDKENEYEHSVWEIYRKEWETASSEKKVELNKRMRRWQELMKNGLTASQAYYEAMQEESDKSPIYTLIEEELGSRVNGEAFRQTTSPISSAPRMRIAPLILLGLALVAAIVYGVVITKDRNALNIELKTVQGVLASTQAQLTKTQSELDSTKQTLASTQAELNSTKQKLSSVQNDLLATKTELDAIDAKLKLYEDTMGIKIFSGVLQPPVKGAEPIKLVNNVTATNPTWQQLMAFLRADPTDDRTWTEDIFVSGDFANMLHNNAEAAGIRAAWVGVRFEDETIGHGLNAFTTTDRGLVYVETQSDWIAYVNKGKEYGTMSLGQNTSLDYASYEKMKADWDSYHQKLEAYNRDVSAYNAGYDAEQRRRARLTPSERFWEKLRESDREFEERVNALKGDGVVNVPDIGTPSWFYFMERNLKERREVLDALRAKLVDLGEPMGIVKSIVIYW